jgi:hypothetical protein
MQKKANPIDQPFLCQSKAYLGSAEKPDIYYQSIYYRYFCVTKCKEI